MLKKKINIFNIVLYVYSLFISYNVLFYINNKYKVLLVFLLSIPFYFIIKKVFKFLERLNIKNTTKFNKWEYCTYAIAIIVPIIFAMIAKYPYIMHNDLVTVLKQADSQIISNWHPVFYIFFMIRIRI